MRRKKERRKLRTKRHPGLDPSDANIAKDSSEESDVSEEDTQDKKHTAKASELPHDAISPSSRPSKRRKTLPQPREAPEALERSDAENSDFLMAGADSPELPTQQQSSALPIFPLPTLPDVPSKSTLALQGLDKALIDAEFVDPDVSWPVPSEGVDDGGTHLSEKTRRRLHESGISELFAGAPLTYTFSTKSELMTVQTALLPFLIPSSNVQHQLYISTRPARDVCVSAPTGSGKTLAYVLPIIEVSGLAPFRGANLSDDLDSFVQDCHTAARVDCPSYKGSGCTGPRDL